MNSINEQQDNTSADRMSISSSQSFIAQNAHDAAVAIEVRSLHAFFCFVFVFKVLHYCMQEFQVALTR